MNRERLTVLRDHLASLPDERVNMLTYFVIDGEPWVSSKKPPMECGTACCIAGWSSVLFNDGSPSGANNSDDDLDLTSIQWAALCCPDGYRSGRLTRADAISAIQSMLDNPADDALPVWPEKAA